MICVAAGDFYEEYMTEEEINTIFNNIIEDDSCDCDKVIDIADADMVLPFPLSALSFA